ncbi:MAG TPA: hypothetical protein VL357_05350 [Rariglobus sp.]|nr:hypothetical protein [Rariglobus sp.]
MDVPARMVVSLGVPFPRLANSGCFGTQQKKAQPSDIGIGSSLTLGKMKLFFIILCGLMAAACSRLEAGSLISPSRTYLLTSEIAGEDAGPTKRYCVLLKVVEIATKKEIQFQTGASNTQKWALGWFHDNILVLYSSDIGIYAYDLADGKITERLAKEDEKEVGRDAYKKKYGERPGA